MLDKNIEKDIKLFMEMYEKPVDESFREITKELVILNANEMISDNDLNIVLRRMYSTYIEILVEKFVLNKFNSIFTTRGMMP